MNAKRYILNLACAVLWLIVGAYPFPSNAQTFRFQSITLAAWGGTHFYTVNGTGFKNIDAIAATGANYITLQIISTLADTSASTFPSTLDDTTVYADILAAARYARSKGLRIALKPHIQTDAKGVLQNSGYCPHDGAAFFAAVEHNLMNNIRLAKQVGADLLIIGTELGGKISGNHSTHGYDNCTAWHKLINRLRAAAPGLTLTYAATMGNEWNYIESNEATRVCFWDALDYMGFDAYPNMNGIKPDATATDFYNRMFDNGVSILSGGDDHTAYPVFALDSFMHQYGLTNQSQVKYIEFVAKGIRNMTGKQNMPVIITEIGTPSTDDVFNCWCVLLSPHINFAAQANGWDGVIPALETERNLIMGINIWSVSPWHNPAITTDTVWRKDWDPVGKPAYNIIKKWFTAKSAKPVVNPF